MDEPLSFDIAFNAIRQIEDRIEERREKMRKKMAKLQRKLDAEKTRLRQLERRMRANYRCAQIRA